MNEKQVEYKKLNKLLRQLDNNNSYFTVICEGLGINHDSSLSEMLSAIDTKDKEITNLNAIIDEMSEGFNEF